MAHFLRTFGKHLSLREVLHGWCVVEKSKIFAVAAGLVLFAIPVVIVEAPFEDEPSAVVYPVREMREKPQPKQALLKEKKKETAARKPKSAPRNENRRVLKPREVAFLLKDAGFPTNAIPRMVCTAKWESLYDIKAKNINDHNGSHDTGLFQINDIWLEECGVTRSQLLNPQINAACARKVFREHGYWAWYGYRYKQDECKKFRLSDNTMIQLSAR
jgi:lysozyme C